MKECFGIFWLNHTALCQATKGGVGFKEIQVLDVEKTEGGPSTEFLH